MARMTSASMLLPKKGPVVQPTPRAVVAAPPRQTVAPVLKVPQGGEVTVRPIDNGFIASSRDKNWNKGSEVFVSDISQLKLNP